MILVIDNYDSFTYNIVQYLQELGARVTVVRNDERTVADLQHMEPAGVLISPGPCNPSKAGISVPAIQAFAGRAPVLGVCLGHQAIGEAFGGRTVRAPQVRHGKTSPILHDGKGVFAGLPNPFSATRYHSLVIDEAALPEALTITARSSDDDLIMGIRHKSLAVEGVQFHPESILSEHGHQLLENWLKQCVVAA